MNNKYYYSIVISFFSGFLSLSQEILWVKLVSFVYFSTPKAFAFVLGVYLIGIALGAFIGQKLCKKSNQNLYLFCGFFLLAAAILEPIFAFLIASIPFENPLNPQIVTYGILISAGLRGAVFPIIHHLGSQNNIRIGASIANVYSANVFGSTLGPLLTGFILLDKLSLQQSFLFISLITIIVSYFCISISKIKIKNLNYFQVFFLIIITIYISPKNEYISIFLTKDASQNKFANHIIQNKHGIIHTFSNPTGDIVFGGNVYDGTTNTDLLINSNRINRAYMVSLLHPNIENILVIGLSTGAWVKTLTSIPTVKKIHVIEINSGYLDLIKKYPNIRSILTDPRITIEITDGRKWLNRHPNEKFDFILMNTTFHWRAYATNLLSDDFLHTVKSHLNEHGVLYYNSTNSDYVHYTASKAFSYAYRYDNFVMSSDDDIKERFLTQNNQSLLNKLTWPDTKQKVFDITEPKQQEAIQNMLSIPLLSIDEFTKNNPHKTLKTITDDNMITEYKYGRNFWP